MNYDMQLMVEHAMRTALEAAQAGPPDSLAGQLSDVQIAAIQSGTLTALFFIALGISIATNEPVEKITARVNFPEFAQDSGPFELSMRNALRDAFDTEQGSHESKH